MIGLFSFSFLSSAGLVTWNLKHVVGYIRSLHRLWRAVVIWQSVFHHYLFTDTPNPLDNFISSLPVILASRWCYCIPCFGFLLRAFACAPWPVSLRTLRCNVLVPPARPAFPLVFVSSCWGLSAAVFRSATRWTFLFMLSLADRFRAPVGDMLTRVGCKTKASSYPRLSKRRIHALCCCYKPRQLFSLHALYFVCTSLVL